MNKKAWIVISAAAVAWSAWFGVMAQPQKPSPKIQWMNDAVYYSTNSMVWDVERNKTLPTNSAFFYTKTVVTTNKVTPFYFLAGDRQVELGTREDGVVVWRHRE
jgi:hypothetical protein